MDSKNCLAYQGTKMVDRLFKGISFGATTTLLLLMGVILVSLIIGGSLCMKTFGWHFLTTATWNPAAKEFGALAPVLGTLTTTCLALLFALPTSFFVAYALCELIPSYFKLPLTILTELLAVIPSIIYGMWGLFVFIPFIGIDLAAWLAKHLGGQHLVGDFFQGPSSGISVLTAGIILSLMIIPFITITFKDAFELVPFNLKESGYALGCTQWEIIWHIMVPYTRIQLIGGTMLGLTRALGETMAVAFVIGNAYNVTASLLHPGTTISSSLANEFTEAESELYTSSLITIGLVLFAITFLVSGSARFLLRRMAQGRGGTSK